MNISCYCNAYDRRATINASSARYCSLSRMQDAATLCGSGRRERTRGKRGDKGIRASCGAVRRRADAPGLWAPAGPPPRFPRRRAPSCGRCCALPGEIPEITSRGSSAQPGRARKQFLHTSGVSWPETEPRDGLIPIAHVRAPATAIPGRVQFAGALPGAASWLSARLLLGLSSSSGSSSSLPHLAAPTGQLTPPLCVSDFTVHLPPPCHFAHSCTGARDIFVTPFL